MGVPAFFRWLSRKYPSIVVHCVEEKGKEVDGVRAPIDSSQPNPNDYEFDNLYLDMNGIIHPCCHPENKEAPKNEDEMMVAIFEYIDRIFSIVRPRKLLYMAIDGVAPRAKMNQQRSRRFRASKESKEHGEEVRRIRSELREKGCSLPPEKEKKEHFDSNCITPGTEFMANLSVCLRYYIADRLNNDPGWKNIKVILSDANVPGEGEHKIMDYIRKQRACPGHDPNTRHCLNGADADLIMLGLATHELHFTIIREEFKPNQKKPCEICGQPGHMMDECQGLPKEKQGEFDELPQPVAQEVEFIFIRLNVLREYLERELRMDGLPFPYNFERCLDDWVFMCFFVGNDFLPHLPSLQIREGAIDRLIRIYKSVLPRCGGYLSENGIVSLSGVQSVLTELGKMEDEIFKRRQENDLAFRRREKEKKERLKRQRQDNDRPLWTPEGQFAPQPIRSNPAPLMGTRQDAFAMRKQGMEVTSRNVANYSAANDLRAMLTPTPDGSLTPQTTPGQTPQSNKRKAGDEEEDDTPKDDIRLWEDGWRERYYEHKFDIYRNDEGYDDFRKTVADAYVEGLCWVLGYYYQGCPSWKWFYPYHYAPFASDFRGIEYLPNTFEKGTQPFKPLEQLMGVFPAASGNFLPVTWRRLMMDPESPIIDFYPVDFRIDLNGKKYAWQGVALLPFVEEKRLLDALAEVYPDLTEEESKRNSRGKDRLFVRGGHPACDFFVGLYEGGEVREAMEIVSDLTQGMSGKVEPDDMPHLPGRVVKSPLPTLYDLKDNRAISVKFSDPSFPDDHIFSANVLAKTEPPPRVLKPEGYDNRTPYRPNVGMNPFRNQRAQLDQSSHRMIDFFTNAGRRNPASAPPQGRPGFSAAPPYARSNSGTPLSSRDQSYRRSNYNYNDNYSRQGDYQRHTYGGGGRGGYNQQPHHRSGPGANYYGNSSQYSSYGGYGSSRDPRQYNQSQGWQDPRQRGDDRRRSYPPAQNRYRPY